MIDFLKPDQPNTEEKDGYEIPSFALAKKPDPHIKDSTVVPLETWIRTRHRNRFIETLYRFLKERNLDDVKVYKAAMISRQYYSKIRSGNIPKKNSILAIGLSMKLNRAQMDELLASAGYALCDTRRTDVIVSWCIEQKKYDLIEVNEILYSHGANLLR